MSSEGNAELGRWRAGKRSPARPDRRRISAKKWLGTALLTALLLLTAGGMLWIILKLFPPRDLVPEYVPLFITRYRQPQIPTIPQGAADRELIRQSTVLGSTGSTDKTDDGLPLQVVQDRLEQLRRKKPKDAIVVYLSTHAVLDQDGHVQILAYDSDPFATSTLLPFQAVLDSLKQCPARQKLLVLDINPDRTSLLELGGTEDGVVDLIMKELAGSSESGKPEDPHLALLTSCSPGEKALWSELLGHSVFGHFFVAGLNDPEADTDGDHAISLRELATYLTQHVDAWARQHRARRQRPMLLGAADSFLLSSLNRRKALPPGRFEKTARNGDLETPRDKTEPTGKNADNGKAQDTNQEQTKGQPDRATTPDTEKSPTSDETYPAWLAKGWELRERWASGPQIAAAPRLFRQLEASLLRSEPDYRVGKDPKELETTLNGTINALSARLEQEGKRKHPAEKSVGQAIAFGKSAEPQLVKALRDMVDRERHPDPTASADQRKAQRAERTKTILQSLKEKTSLDLALVIVDSAQDARLDADTLQLLDSIVADSLLPRNVIELRLLHQLADRARQSRPNEWDDELARKIWDAVVLAEKANNQPRAFAWLRGQLDEADALRHEAEVMLLPQALGYSSPRQLADAWEQVAQTYAFINDMQNKIKDGGLAVLHARATLPAYLPFLEATGGGRSDRWLEAARTEQALDTLLKNPDGKVASASSTRDQLDVLGRKWTETTRELQDALTDLLRPFRTEAAQRLIARSRDNIPDARLGEEIETLLQTPFLRASDRQELWKASLELDRRLGELSDQNNQTTTSADDPADRSRTVNGLVERRKQRLKALLGMAVPGSTVQEQDTGDVSGSHDAPAAVSTTTGGQTSVGLLSRSWGDLSRFARSVHSRILDALDREKREPGQDRPAWIAPAFALDEGPNPVRLIRERQDLAVWSWLAGRYLHESRDLPLRIGSSDAFYESAYVDLQGASPFQPEPDLRLSQSGLAGNILQLTSRHKAADGNVQLILGPTDAGLSSRVAISVLQPDDPRLQVSRPHPAEMDLTPATARESRIHMGWDESRAGTARTPPAGVIVKARFASGRAFHLLVPVEIVSENAVPRLVLRANPTQDVELPFDPLRLRTLPGRQAFSVMVKNPSPVSRQVVVDIKAGDTVIASSSQKEKPALEIKPNSTVSVSFGEPTAKPSDPLPEVPRHLSLRLRDAASGQEYETREFRPQIAAPLEYIEVVRPQFIPARPGEVNRLEVTIRSLPQMTGPPCPVTLQLPADPELFPAFLEAPRGNLEGVVEAGGKPLQLYAEDIKLNPNAQAKGLLSLSVDGLARALWYQTRFVLQGQNQKVEPVSRGRVRFQPELSVQPDKPARLTVRFNVDSAPATAILLFRLGHMEGNEFKDDIKYWSDRAKPQHIGFDPRGPGGSVVLEASVGDWSKEFNVPGIRGRRFLYAYLLDASGRETIDTFMKELTLDDVPPQINSLEVPQQIEVTASRITVRATVKPTESRIKDVSFLVNPGSKGDFAKAEAENKVVIGKPSSADPDTWEATLPVPKGSTGKLIVSARATNGVGLTGQSHGEVAIKEPPPEPAEASDKPKEETPGAIEGKVTENDVAQPGLTVYLLDPKAKNNENPVKDQKKTAQDGTYAFPDLKPGLYRVFCLKEATNRRAMKDLTVESGKTLRQDLDLLLP